MSNRRDESLLDVRRDRLHPSRRDRRAHRRADPPRAPGRSAAMPVLTRDGKKIAFCVDHENRLELWQKSLVDGRETPIMTDGYDRRCPQWSPDGTRLAYTRSNYQENQGQLMVWSRESGSEEALTASSSTEYLIFDWSLDDKWFLASRGSEGSKEEVWTLPLASAPHAETAARRILADPRYDLWQPTFSPNGRWILFEAVENSPTSAESSIYVAPVEGGSWIRITDGKRS